MLIKVKFIATNYSPLNAYIIKLVTYIPIILSYKLLSLLFIMFNKALALSARATSYTNRLTLEVKKLH